MKNNLNKKENEEIEDNITQVNIVQEKNNNQAEEGNNISNVTLTEQNIVENKSSNTASQKNTSNKTNTSSTKKSETSDTSKKNTTTTNQTTRSKAVFTSSSIPDSVLKKMIGNSIPTKDKDKVDIKQLSYLRISYWGFDEKTHVGEMIVNKKLAGEVLAIFKEVYNKKYPIEKIKLIDDYGANDEKSMADNNSSAFCYRTIANTNKLSNHSLGKAIDINPLYNPYVVGSSVSPANGKKYADRSIVRKGTIKKGDDLYNAFIKRGWTWGGNWSSKKDYQHFEKK